ncbi:MAG: transposase [Methylocella sp.]
MRHALGTRIAAIEARIMAWHGSNAMSQRPAAIPGIGPIIARIEKKLALRRLSQSEFHSGREFSAWLGLVPRQNSAGGKTRLGGIGKRGGSYLRRLLVKGARAALLRSKAAKADHWLIALRGRGPRLVAAAALANKTARIAWAMPTKQDSRRFAAATAYPPRAAAQPQACEGNEA